MRAVIRVIDYGTHLLMKGHGNLFTTHQAQVKPHVRATQAGGKIVVHSYSARRHKAADLPDWLQGDVDTKGHKHLPPENVADFRPGVDEVRRHGHRVFVVDTEGQYAPREVRPDEIAHMDRFHENAKKQTDMGKIHHAMMHVSGTPYLSREGKEERIAALKARGREIQPHPFQVV